MGQYISDYQTFYLNKQDQFIKKVTDKQYDTIIENVFIKTKQRAVLRLKYIYTYTKCQNNFFLRFFIPCLRYNADDLKFCFVGLPLASHSPQRWNDR